jgi:ubiquinone/menaquinone biosynthesis C-methylase UbiE
MGKFELGAIKVSTAAANALTETCLELETLLTRHQDGDWGNVDNAQRLRNEWAVEHNGLIRSVYELPNGALLLVSTAITRSYTWAMLETEYQSKEVGIQEGYALWATFYDQEENPLIAAEEPHVDLIMAKLAVTVALDVGTGTGRYARKLAQRGIKIVAVDQCPEMLDVAQRYARENELRIDFQCGELRALPFRSNHFELVVCGLVLCHVPNLVQTIGEFSRVTRAGGHLLVTDFHPNAVAAGGRTVFLQAEAWYLLPNIRHTRDDYLEAMEVAGFKLLDVIDLYVRDIPDETIPFYETWVREKGDELFGLIIFAQKVETADRSEICQTLPPNTTCTRPANRATKSTSVSL